MASPFLTLVAACLRGWDHECGGGTTERQAIIWSPWPVSWKELHFCFQKKGRTCFVLIISLVNVEQISLATGEIFSCLSSPTGGDV